MMTKVTYLLHARADEDLRSGPLTATDTRQSTGESRQALLERARHVPEGGAAADSHGLTRTRRQQTRRLANPQLTAMQRHRLPKLTVQVESSGADLQPLPGIATD